MGDVHKVMFVPVDRTISAEADKTLLETAMAAGIHITRLRWQWRVREMQDKDTGGRNGSNKPALDIGGRIRGRRAPCLPDAPPSLTWSWISP